LFFIRARVTDRDTETQIGTQRQRETDREGQGLSVCEEERGKKLKFNPPPTQRTTNFTTCNKNNFPFFPKV
jgi:hypothetical protein